MDVNPTAVRLTKLGSLFFLIGAISFALSLASDTVLSVEVVYLLVSCVIYCLVIYMTASTYARRSIRRFVNSLFVKSTKS